MIDHYWKKSVNYTSSDLVTQRGLDSFMPFAGYRSNESSGIGGQESW